VAVGGEKRPAGGGGLMAAAAGGEGGARVGAGEGEASHDSEASAVVLELDSVSQHLIK
jgi:hypothetical protein